MLLSIPWSRLQLLIFLDCQARSADRLKLETMMLFQSRMPERAASLHACSRRHFLTPTFRATPSASEKQRLRHTRYRSQLLCEAASSTEPVDLKFVTQGRNLKLTDALRDFAVRTILWHCLNMPGLTIPSSCCLRCIYFATLQFEFVRGHSAG